MEWTTRATLMQTLGNDSVSTLWNRGRGTRTFPLAAEPPHESWGNLHWMAMKIATCLLLLSCYACKRPTACADAGYSSATHSFCESRRLCSLSSVSVSIWRTRSRERPIS